MRSDEQVHTRPEVSGSPGSHTSVKAFGPRAIGIAMIVVLIAIGATVLVLKLT